MANKQTIPRPEVPASIAAPAGEEVVLRVRASGWQVYVCQAGTEQKPAWTLKGPLAELHDTDGKLIGTHYAGPTWKHEDGSEVKGKLVSKTDAPDANAIPWLLLTVAGHAGSGILSNVTSIQRISTEGGEPPQGGCDDGKVAAETSVPYSADYYFYAPAR
jgi:uncharacterized protein DUF3455